MITRKGPHWAACSCQATWGPLALCFYILLISSAKSFSQRLIDVELSGIMFQEDSISHAAPELSKQDASTSFPLKDDLPESQRLRDSGRSFALYSGGLPALLDALNVMQSNYFEIWLGNWPDAIDWTAAVMGTHVSASLSVITRSDTYEEILAAAGPNLEQQPKCAVHENLINQYFTQLLSFYHGENAFALRSQAYDDMLWVVLGWLESIKFVHLHSALHYTSTNVRNQTSPWYATQFIPAFAHRARIFYDLASKGWDTSLCGGGMIWNPYLAPYKNAITNQLYIAASVSMYLYFPGDYNNSPFVTNVRDPHDAQLPPAKAHDPKYLKTAIEAYNWLGSSNMTNSKGLYVDGFHIHGWRGGNKNGSIGSGKCDIRDEKVYTYNQGVLLSAMRGLWEATGAQIYLHDGHSLIRNVISATGWNDKGSDDRREWAGIGRSGILEESCDARGACSQDAQTFKGIFFHHMTAFCAPLPVGKTERAPFKANVTLEKSHQQNCREYWPWIRHNAAAAYRTRDGDGKYGTWWTYGLWHSNTAVEDGEFNVPEEGTDYRNSGVPRNTLWRLATDPEWQSNDSITPEVLPTSPVQSQSLWDPNIRGRGRTVETQSGGVAVLRALLKLVEMHRG